MVSRARIPRGPTTCRRASWRPTRRVPIRRSLRRARRFASSRAACSNCRCTTPRPDRTRPIGPRSGLIFSKDPSPREVPRGSSSTRRSGCRPGPPTSKVDADVEFAQDATVWGVFPHTHVRGKKWEYVLQLPDGSKKTILSVPRYDFNWQTYYMFKEPLQVPKGSKMISTGVVRQLARQPIEPRSHVDVKWGDQTWEEMQYTGILVFAGRNFTADRQRAVRNRSRHE